MLNPIQEPIMVGSEAWETNLRLATMGLGADFWSGFTPVDPDEIVALESSINRVLPCDLRCFLSTMGSGDFPDQFGGGIFSPEEIIEGCAGPLLMLLGCAPWATDEDQRAFYISRGTSNPNPDKFVNGITKYSSIDLPNLIQIGYDGMSCYYQVFCNNVGGGFCRITPELTLDDRCESFSHGLWRILTRCQEQISS